MSTRRIEVIVGTTVIAALAIMVGGVTWLKEIQLAREFRVWQVRFPEVGGLSPNDEVQVNGLKRGEVRSMRLTTEQVAVEVALAAEVQLTTESRIAVRSVGLMGEKIIAVDLRSGGRRLDSRRDTIQGVFERGIPEVMGQLGEAMGGIQELTRELRTIADALNRNGQLQASVRNFHDTSEELRLVVQENRAALRSTLRDFAAAAQSARGLTAEREAELGTAVDHFVSAAAKMDRLADRLDSLRASIASVAGKVDRGEGTLGKLVNDERLYTDLHGAVEEFRKLVADVKANPKKYLKVEIF
jgi:phospholipid/cholesterol/gamma-HCH transport system substrate-binding protein